MTLPADTHDLSALSNAALASILEEVEREERFLSDRRRELHDIIDTNDEASDPSQDITLRERALSTRRLELHRRIAELRLEKNRRLNALRAPLRAVENSRG